MDRFLPDGRSDRAFSIEDCRSTVIAPNRASLLSDDQRIVITGIGLTAPNGNDWASFREALLEKRSGVQPYEIRYFGKTLAGICDFDLTRYQTRKDVRRGTRAGSVGVYCANEAVKHSGIDWDNVDKSRVGVYVGVTEHGNVETENEILRDQGISITTPVVGHTITIPEPSRTIRRVKSP